MPSSFPARAPDPELSPGGRAYLPRARPFVLFIPGWSTTDRGSETALIVWACLWGGARAQARGIERDRGDLRRPCSSAPDQPTRARYKRLAISVWNEPGKAWPKMRRGLRDVPDRRSNTARQARGTVASLDIAAMTTQRRKLYASSNGDTWYLCRDRSGTVIVSHEPNVASGGKPSQVDVGTFLANRTSRP